MKKIISCLCAIMLLVSIPATAFASEVTPRASEYFGYTDVRASAIGNGKILIEISVDATHLMNEVGASSVDIYEQQTNGSYRKVFTFTKTSYPNLIVEDSFFGYVDVTYRGTPGKNYYAIVGCFAKDNAGSEILYHGSNYVTA